MPKSKNSATGEPAPRISAARRAAIARRPDALRREPKVWHRELPQTVLVCQFLDTHVIPHLQFDGYKIADKQAMCRDLILNAMVAYDAGKVVAIPMDNRFVADELKKLVKAGFVTIKKGSQESRCVTRYELAHDLQNRVRKQDFQLQEIVDTKVNRSKKKFKTQAELEQDIIVLHKGEKRQKHAVALPKLPKRISELADRLEAINEFNSRYAWTFKRKVRRRKRQRQAVIEVRAVFRDDFDHCGRLYSQHVNGYTNIPRKERRTLRVNGKKTAEVDFKSHLPRLLYHVMLKKDVKGDIYRPELTLPELYERSSQRLLEGLGIAIDDARDLVKQALLRCLNAKTRAIANSSIGKYALKHGTIGKALAIIGVSPKDIPDRLAESHKPLADFFFTRKALKLQASHEMPLMVTVLERIHAQKKPALGLHDGVICRKKDWQLVQGVMLETYRELIGFEPEIERER